LWLEAYRTAIRLANENPISTALPQLIASALTHIDMIPLTHDVLDAARRIPQTIKSLDAIHVATAESLGNKLHYVATADKTMLAVLAQRGVATCP
jgi:predicted nucleic acid-binding protein